MFVNTSSDTIALEFDEDSSAKRVGTRIRNIRNAKGMSQPELGQKVGLSADRIQKYENGVRKPKADMLNQIASALEVSPLALADPVLTNYIGAMYAMFELEKNFNMKISHAPAKQTQSYFLAVNPQEELSKYMEEWHRVFTLTETELEAASSEQEKKEILDSYHNWEWNFPKGITSEADKELQKARLKKKIEELQRAYDQLDQTPSNEI